MSVWNHFWMGATGLKLTSGPNMADVRQQSPGDARSFTAELHGHPIPRPVCAP